MEICIQSVEKTTLDTQFGKSALVASMYVIIIQYILVYIQKVWEFPDKFDGGQCASINYGTEGMLCSPILDPEKCIKVANTNHGFDWTFSRTNSPHSAGDVVE